MSKNVPYTLVALAKRDLLPAVPGNLPRQSCYKFNYVKGSHRAPCTPRTHRQYRMRHLHGLMAFYRNRFYEKDRWYKARIEKPLIYPTCYYIEPHKYKKSLSERLEELQLNEPTDEPVDIGLPFVQKDQSSPSTTSESDFAKLNQVRSETEKQELERAARLRRLRIDPNVVEAETRADSAVFAPLLMQIAAHYGLFKDLFHPSAYFYPVVPLNVYYGDSDDPDALNPVSYGNTLAPKDATKIPIVRYEAEANSLWTLLLTNADGNLFENGKEVVHWMVCNIPENRVQDGETIIDYLQPVPPRGTGYHRMVFVLFRQDEGRVDFSSTLREHGSVGSKLERRTFHTPSFYKRHEDQITPAGLAFFQSAWDDSCSECFHRTLDTQEPIYEYDWPKPYLPPQEEYPPEMVSFHQYLDKYRDHKDIEKELLTKRLKRISPFVNDVADAREKRRRRYFPNVFLDQYATELPTWLHMEKMRENRGLGKYKAIYENKIE